MDFLTLFLLALGLCFDSFAVSMTCGMTVRGWRLWQGLRFALILGLFQGVMPLLGWGLTHRFSGLVEHFDHWIAFVLLAFLGGKMIWQSRHEDEQKMAPCDAFAIKRSSLIGLATSIDAMASGIAIAMMPMKLIEGASLAMSMAIIVIVIAAVTVVASYAGLVIGSRSGRRLGAKAELVGGIILIGIGVKVLVEHMA